MKICIAWISDFGKILFGFRRIGCWSAVRGCASDARSSCPRTMIRGRPGHPRLRRLSGESDIPSSAVKRQQEHRFACALPSCRRFDISNACMARTGPAMTASGHPQRSAHIHQQVAKRLVVQIERSVPDRRCLQRADCCRPAAAQWTTALRKKRSSPRARQIGQIDPNRPFVRSWRLGPSSPT